MKTEVILNEEEKVIEYPKLMMSCNDKIVLFSGPGAGVVIDVGKGFHNEGYYSNDWDMCFFSDFKGKVVLSN